MIVIVEYAAEIVEPHMVSSLKKVLNILYSRDHRPKPNDHDMAKKYKLNILRLNVSFWTTIHMSLNIQYRNETRNFTASKIKGSCNGL